MKKILLVLLLTGNAFLLFSQRTYSYIDAIDKVHYANSGSVYNVAWCPIWEDSTILNRQSSGYSANIFTSVAAAINPDASLFNHQTYVGEMKVTTTDTFYIDSIYLNGAYLTPNGTGAVSGDRLEISVVLESDTNVYTRSIGSGGSSPSPYLTNAIPPTMDTMIRGVVPYADSISRVAGFPNRVRYTWTYNFTNNDTSAPTANSSYNVKRFGFAPPNPIQALPGDIAIVSFTFFSGASWNNTDSISYYPGTGSQNHFRAQFHEEIPNSRMLYRNHTENSGGDFCNSSIMFSRRFNLYEPTIQVEEFNIPAFAFEHLDVEWVISCPNCSNVVGIDQVNKPFEGLRVYPNPTADYVLLNFSEPFQSEVQCTVYTISGEKLMNTTFAKNLSIHKLDFHDLPTGVYVCELKGGGRQQSIRLVKH